MVVDALDPVIDRWAQAHGLSLFSEGAQGKAVRFCYTSSAQGECFQLVVRSQLAGHVLIEAFSIEAAGDEELHRAWQVPTAALASGLEQALRTVEDWKQGKGRANL